LQADRIAPRVDIVGVAGCLRPSHEGSVEDVAIVVGRVAVAVVHAAGPSMVRIQRRIVAEADDVAPSLRIVADHVVDLPHRKVMVAAALVTHGVAVDERGDRRIKQLLFCKSRYEQAGHLAFMLR